MCPGDYVYFCFLWEIDLTNIVRYIPQGNIEINTCFYFCTTRKKCLFFFFIPVHISRTTRNSIRFQYTFSYITFRCDVRISVTCALTHTTCLALVDLRSYQQKLFHTSIFFFWHVFKHIIFPSDNPGKNFHITSFSFE